ncbi:hypothetical protein HDU78_008949 [Chytriomyces hyalinus]|nr:hypothetical protein HDU78_008949 [Chytriomyces hyalinus]
MVLMNTLRQQHARLWIILRHNRKSLVAGVIICIGLLGTVGGLLALSLVGIAKTRVAANEISSGNANEFGSPDFATIEAEVAAIDLVAQTLKLHIWVGVSDTLSAKPSTQSSFAITSAPINVTFSNVQINFPKNDVLSLQAAVIPIFGDSYLYPFDVWETVIEVFATYQPPGSSVALPLPVLVHLYGNPNGFDASFNFSVVNSETLAAVRVQRTTTSKTFVMFLSLSMWALSLSTTLLAISLWAFGKRTEAPHITFTAAILFALPGVRNAMPAAPPIGALVDQLVLVWSMPMVCGSLLMYFVRMITAVIAERDVLENKHCNCC